jgi:hypothetical protein
MTRLTIIDNRITHTVEMRLDRTISFEPTATGSPINVGGKWGKVVSNGMLVDSIKYNPNRWKGITSHKEVLAEMKSRMTANQ